MASSVVDFRVQNFFDFVFDFSIDFDRRWRRLDVVGNTALVGGLELRHVEYWVHGLHGVGELECEGEQSRFGYYFKGSEILVGELLGWACRPEKLRFHIDLITYLEIWRS